MNEWKTLFTIFNLKRHLLVDMLELPYWTNILRDIYTNRFSRMITNFIGAKDLVSKLRSIHTLSKTKLFFFYLFLSLFTLARCELTFTKKTQPSKSSALSLQLPCLLWFGVNGSLRTSDAGPKPNCDSAKSWKPPKPPPPAAPPIPPMFPKMFLKSSSGSMLLWKCSNPPKAHKTKSHRNPFTT